MASAWPVGFEFWIVLSYIYKYNIYICILNAMSLFHLTILVILDPRVVPTRSDIQVLWCNITPHLCFGLNKSHTNLIKNAKVDRKIQPFSTRFSQFFPAFSYGLSDFWQVASSLKRLAWSAGKAGCGLMMKKPSRCARVSRRRGLGGVLLLNI